MKLGRPPKTTRTVHWTLSLPEPLAAELELLMLDPMLGKPKVGARSALVEGLIREWIATQRRSNQHKQPFWVSRKEYHEAVIRAKQYTLDNQCTAHLCYTPLGDSFSISDWYDGSVIETYHNGELRS